MKNILVISIFVALALLASAALVSSQSIDGDRLKNEQKSGIDKKKYNIDIAYIGNVTEAVKESVEKAKARWESIIKSDVPGTFKLKKNKNCFLSFVKLPETKVIDDLLIFVIEANGDGEGGGVGQIGICYATKAPKLYARVAVIGLDVDDVGWMAQNKTLDMVTTRAMGNAIGFSIFWEKYKLVPKSSNLNPVAPYRGNGGKKGLKAIGGTGKPFVSKMGNSNTPYVQWDGNMYPYELMSSYPSADIKLSKLTILSFEDIGFKVDETQADAYTIPPNLQAINSDAGNYEEIATMEFIQDDMVIGEADPY